jgi:hypothetical protein
VFRSRQFLNVFAGIAQGAEHTAIRQWDRNVKGARALAKAKQRGVIFGSPNAAARDAKLKPILEGMWEMPYREIAQELTSRNIPTPRGCDLWML